ncbi:hypothetical protein EQG49_01625 [Periweissella cryptocerci]|uniref:Uncharacterized protein n=1 Tax=Periweissella cryptocerci TaxID=2506420 RepID=A0A4P6YRH2_9LACO|nr:hypothetical protein [Periweissella cryptocerci]QBO35249.1 hypothetical protein EQG49_01625 [Periweissella cryptocerci]
MRKVITIIIIILALCSIGRAINVANLHSTISVAEAKTLVIKKVEKKYKDKDVQDAKIGTSFLVGNVKTSFWGSTYTMEWTVNGVKDSKTQVTWGTGGTASVGRNKIVKLVQKWTT